MLIKYLITCKLKVEAKQIKEIIFVEITILIEIIEKFTPSEKATI